MSSRNDALLIPGRRAWVALAGAAEDFSWICSFSPGGQEIFFTRNSAKPPTYIEGIHEDSSQDFVARFSGPTTAYFFVTLGDVPVQVTWH